MSDILLPTHHPLEFQNNRQSTKITYLQREIHYLQDTVKDLEQLVKINKDALKLMTNQFAQSNLKPKSGRQDDVTTSITEQALPEKQKDFYLLYEQSQEENCKLIEIIEKINKERLVAQSKALINEQICEEVQRHEMEVISEMEQKIDDLRKQLQDKEYFIQQLEKTKPFPFQEGVVVKYREVMDASTQNMKLHEEMTKYKAMLGKVSYELNKAQREREELTTTNTTLNNELSKLKAILAHPMNQKPRLSAFSMSKEGHTRSQTGQVTNKSPPSSVMKIPDDHSFTSSRNSSPKEEKGHKDRKAPLFKKKKSKTIPLRPRNDAAYQSTNALYDMKLLEKIHTLESDLEKEKDKLTRESMNNELLSDELSKLKRAWVEITAVNEILCKSNKKYQEKRSQMLQTIEFYKGFYYKYLDIIKNPQTFKRSDSFSMPKTERAGKLKKLVNFETKASPGKITDSSDDKIDKLVNLSGGDLNDDQRVREQKLDEEKGPKTAYDFNKEQSKAYLLNLAKDFYETNPMNNPAGAKHMIQQIEKRQRAPRSKNRVKRSLSNPLDYIFERKKVVYGFVSDDDEPTTKPDKQKKDELVLQDNSPEGNKANESFVEEFKAEKLPKTNLIRLISAKKNDDVEDVLSFTVDTIDLDRVKNNNQSFMSNNEILRTLE